MREFGHLARAQAQAEAGLSAQEIKVLRLVAAGATNREIADRLYWSEAMVKKKVSRRDFLKAAGLAADGAPLAASLAHPREVAAGLQVACDSLARAVPEFGPRPLQKASMFL